MTGEPSVAIDRDGGSIDMHTGPTGDVARALATDGETLRTEWGKQRAAMDAIERTIGNPAMGDTLSSTFRNAYNPAVEQLVKAHDDAAAALGEAAQNGEAAVDEYLGADARAGQTMRSVSRQV